MVRPGPTDAELVNRSLTGDRAAFGLLVDRHRPGVARLLRAMFANLGGVQDLVQESFLRAYLDLERLRDPGRFGAWVRGIAVNLARVELRSGRLALIPWEAVGPGSGKPQPSPESLAVRRELVRRIRQAIAGLPPAEREAIARVYLDEMSHKEAAKELDTSVGAIKVRVHRGRKRLRKKLVVEFPAREGQMEVEMIEVTVQDVLAKQAIEETLAQVDLSTSPAQRPDEWLKRFNLHRVVLLAEVDGQRLLPIWIGPVEGEAAAIHLRGQSPISRPLTFDLMRELFAVGGMQLQGVAISRLHEKVFYGILMVKTNGGDAREIDCRPSDAINLALRMDASIFVAPEIMDQLGIIPEEGGGYEYLQSEPGEQWVSIIQS